MVFSVLNPTDQRAGEQRSLAPRLTALAGKTVGFISNGKQGTKGFFTHLEHLLRTETGVSEVHWLVKPNYSAPAGSALIESASHWDFGVTGLGD